MLIFKLYRLLELWADIKLKELEKEALEPAITSRRGSLPGSTGNITTDRMKKIRGGEK